MRVAIGAARSAVDDTDYKRDIDAVRNLLGQEVFAAAWSAGEAMPLEQTIVELLGMESNHASI